MVKIIQIMDNGRMKSYTIGIIYETIALIHFSLVNIFKN